MAQFKSGDITHLKRAVNVASVPQRSPFRYPGGKTWLIPQIKAWLNSQPKRPGLLVEPFAGGGIVSLTVAFERLADRVLMVELDEHVASVWAALLGGDADWLADHIINFNMNQQSLERELSSKDNSLRQTAFKALLRNRTSHGGIMAPGAGLIKYGEQGKGINSRWYPQTLAKRIHNIGKISDKIDFIHGDGIAIIQKFVERTDAVFFIDPPYTASGKKAGTRLYTYHEIDHEELFSLVKTLCGDFLMTYDNAAGVRSMAEQHGFDTVEIAMKNTHHANMNELLIGRDLGWARCPAPPGDPGTK